MKRSLDTRKVLSIATVTVGTSILLLLGSTSIFDNVSLAPLVVLFSLLPILVIAMFVSYIIGTSKTLLGELTSIFRRTGEALVTSTVVAACRILG